MNAKKIVKKWFEAWEQGDFLNLPISENFQHTSPFGMITGRKTYIKLVQENKGKFLGYTFEIHDAIYEVNKACVRYTAKQDQDFRLEVSEWYYVKHNLIEEIIAYYHIGEIRDDRKIENYST